MDTNMDGLIDIVDLTKKSKNKEIKTKIPGLGNHRNSTNSSSPARKLKSPQSNTLNPWLTKDLTKTPTHSTLKPKAKLLTKASSDDIKKSKKIPYESNHGTASSKLQRLGPQVSSDDKIDVSSEENIVYSSSPNETVQKEHSVKKQKKKRPCESNHGTASSKLQSQVSSNDKIDLCSEESIVYSSSPIETVKEEHYVKKRKKKKKHRRDSPKTDVNSKEKFIDNSKNNVKMSNNKNTLENTYQCGDVNISVASDVEEVARKKFRRILASPLSTTRKKSIFSSPQSNTLSKWLNKHDDTNKTCSFSYHNSEKVILDESECKENNDKNKLLGKAKDVRSNTERKSKLKEVNLKLTTCSNVLESTKCNQQQVVISEETNNNSTEIKKKRKQITREDIPPIKQKKDRRDRSEIKNQSPVNTKVTGSTKPAPVTRKLYDVDLFSQSSTTSTWLGKDTSQNKVLVLPSTSSKMASGKNKADDSETVCKRSNRYEKLDIKIKGDKNPKKRKLKKNIPHQTLDNYFTKDAKNSSKRKLSKSEANDGHVSPSVVEKGKVKKKKTSDLFKKYGVAVPSLEEILKDQKDLEKYKNQIESFENIDDKTFELPFSVKEVEKNEISDVELLDCQHLSLHDIEEAFKDNIDYISSIFHGKKYSERHERYFEKSTKNYTFTVKDLCYSTSTIVFTFDQKDHLITLLKNEFDPEDKWTTYFFKVLLPELCLKIFMDTHNMTLDEAVKYLDTRPIVD